MLACQCYLRLAFARSVSPTRWSTENVRVFRVIRIDRDNGDRRCHAGCVLSANYGGRTSVRGGAIYLKERAFTLLSGET